MLIHLSLNTCAVNWNLPISWYTLSHVASPLTVTVRCVRLFGVVMWCAVKVVRPARLDVTFSEFERLLHRGAHDPVFQNVSFYIEYSELGAYFPEMQVRYRTCVAGLASL